MGHPVAFFEVISDDPERAQQFHVESFDWQELPGDFGRIAIAADPDGNAVGLWA